MMSLHYTFDTLIHHQLCQQSVRYFKGLRDGHDRGRKSRNEHAVPPLLSESCGARTMAQVSYHHHHRHLLAPPTDTFNHCCIEC